MRNNAPALKSDISSFRYEYVLAYLHTLVYIPKTSRNMRRHKISANIFNNIHPNGNRAFDE
jgi:hypothetical protein